MCYLGDHKQNTYAEIIETKETLKGTPYGQRLRSYCLDECLKNANACVYHFAA